MVQIRFHGVAEVLMSLLQKGQSPIGQSYLMSKLWAYWPQIMPAQVAKSTQPIALKYKVLYIWVKNSTWMYELNLNKKSILQKVQTAMGEGIIQDIVLTLDLKTLPQDILQNESLRQFILEQKEAKIE
jgi:predicted nucleic acid-binding Zn ribbon protein